MPVLLRQGLELEQVIMDLLFGESVRRSVKVGLQLPDGAEIRFLGALAQAGELEVLVHPLPECCSLAQCGGHRKVLSQRSKRNTSAKNPV